MICTTLMWLAPRFDRRVLVVTWSVGCSRWTVACGRCSSRCSRVPQAPLRTQAQRRRHRLSIPRTPRLQSSSLISSWIATAGVSAARTWLCRPRSAKRFREHSDARRVGYSAAEMPATRLQSTVGETRIRIQKSERVGECECEITNAAGCLSMHNDWKSRVTEDRSIRTIARLRRCLSFLNPLVAHGARVSQLASTRTFDTWRRRRLLYKCNLF